ncbi:tRNA nuclease WapA precursor [mine drainage metagenome]|uniref:tRNA nuclease WapA n=1 Tax=mine drainage metagenome TaxID=410659 RepID=A0A1J5RGY0_9ZZZZ
MKYDADGNLTEDGTWQYPYDGENRLTKMINKSNNAYTLTFAYDYLGRRIRKTVANGPWGSTDTKFLWFGWNLAAELSADGVTPNKAFVWGPDFSDAHGNAGGAGSLLAQISGGVMNYAVPDTLGNIVAYTSNGTLSAAVEYSPFGRATTTYGSYSNFPMGYSGHYTDWETGLSYYGLRYYMPKHGRFINRDPSEEAGGTNLFAFTGNNPTNSWDVLGLLDDSVDELAVFHVYGDRPPTWDPVADYNNQLDINFGNANLAQTITPPTSYRGGYGNSGNATGPSKGSGKGKGDGKSPSLPPCSKLRAQIDSGKLKPSVTAQSFIEQKSIDGFLGDNRGFLNSPANATSYSFRVSSTVQYGMPAQVVGGYSRFGPMYIGDPVGVGAVAGPFYIARQAQPVGGGNVVRSGYNFSLSYSVSASNGLLPFLPSAIQNGSVTVNYNTGSYLAVLSHTQYPAAQVFLDGSPIYNYSSDKAGAGVSGLGADHLETHIVAGQICDPSK